MDSFFVDWAGDGKTGLVLTALDTSQTRDQPKKFLFFKRSSDRWAEIEMAPPIRAMHPRHISTADINGDGKPDILISDHGPDRFPWPGGHTHLLLSGQNNRNHLKEIDLPWKTMFNYSACFFRATREKNLDVLQMNISNDPRDIRVFRGNGRGEFIPTEKWLQEGKDLPPTCFMSCHVADLDGDGDPEIILGGCDRDQQSGPPSQDDIILKRGESGLYGFYGNKLGAREKDKTWGTAHIVTGHFQSVDRVDIAIATHNFGFTKASVQVFLQQGNLDWKEASFPYETAQGTQSFIPWISIGKVTSGGLDDLLFVLRQVSEKVESQVHLFQSDGNHFLPINLPLELNALGPFIGGQIFDYDGKGKNSIVLLSRNHEIIVVDIKKL